MRSTAEAWRNLIAAEMARSGGLITREDLAAYRAVERPPVTGTYRGVRVVSMGPPSSGGVALVALLNVLESYPLAQYGANSSQTIHLVAEAARRVYADRAQWLGDPDFTAVPVAGLTSKRYAAHLRASINPAHATPSATVKAGSIADLEATQTTHYSVVDEAGNAVAVTTTLNGGYGNGQLVPGAGFLLNNEMDDFSAKPGAPNMFGLVGGTANAIEPGKRMLSSMTPTILVRDGRTWFVTGSPGGSHIITTVLQTVLDVVDFGMTVQEAVGYAAVPPPVAPGPHRGGAPGLSGGRDGASSCARARRAGFGRHGRRGGDPRGSRDGAPHRGIRSADGRPHPRLLRLARTRWTR